ncbi:hypothetical protein BJX99DRAFT_46708 [Aspergillus californicus]
MRGSNYVVNSRAYWSWVKPLLLGLLCLSFTHGCRCRVYYIGTYGTIYQYEYLDVMSWGWWLYLSGHTSDLKAIQVGKGALWKLPRGRMLRRRLSGKLTRIVPGWNGRLWLHWS